MPDNSKHKIKLSEIEMRMIKESVENIAYLGIHSKTVSSIRKKMTVKIPDSKSEQEAKQITTVK